MDFRVTHFLVADSVSDSTTIEGLANASMGAFAADGTDRNLDGISGALTLPFQLVQGLNRTDAIEKELGVIKSGIINPSKIVSVRKLVGSDDYSRQGKIFGAAGSMLTYNGGGTVFPTSATVTANTFYYISSGSHLFYCITSSGNTAASVPTTTSLVVGDTIASGSNIFIYLGANYVSAETSTSNRIEIGRPGSSVAAGTLEFEADKEYTFSVRVRSAQANNISPFGITRGYSAMASKTFVSTSNGASSTSNQYAPFSALFNLVKNFADDTMMASFVNVTAAIHFCSSSDGTVTDIVYFKNGNILNPVTNYTGVSTNATTNIPSHLLLTSRVASTREVIIDVTKYSTWHEALTVAQAAVPGFYPLKTSDSGVVTIGKTYTAALMVDAKEQINYNLSYASGVTDPTIFPYKWDIVRLNGYFHEGPYGAKYDWYSTTPINAGVSTQTPIVFDQTQSGLITPFTIAINTINFSDFGSTACTQTAGYAIGKYKSVTGSIGTSKEFTGLEVEVKFPNLLKEEVRHIAHQYQSYSLKYKQQFKSPRYNAMVMDPFQSKITANGPYTLYYIEYMPEVDTTYTSTQPMTNLTIVATANSTLITQLDHAFVEALETAS
jgi:hypothetical protein